MLETVSRKKNANETQTLLKGIIVGVEKLQVEGLA